MFITRTCFHDEETKSFTHMCEQKRRRFLHNENTPILTNDKGFTVCRLFLKQCVVGTSIYQIRFKEAISIIVNYNY